MFGATPLASESVQREPGSVETSASLESALPENASDPPEAMETVFPAANATVPPGALQERLLNESVPLPQTAQVPPLCGARTTELVDSIVNVPLFSKRFVTVKVRPSGR